MPRSTTSRARRALIVVPGALVLSAPATLPAPAQAATGACSGVYARVDFPSIPATARTLTAVERTGANSQVVTTLRRTRGCTFSTVATRRSAITGVRLPAATATSTVAVRQAGTNIIERRIIGRSVKGRPIIAYLVGDPRATATSMVLGNMHGDEPAVRTTANAIVNGPRITGVRLWVIPTMNPDGLAAGTRTNARGVDLNRNWPDHWQANERGRYWAGTRPLTEPEDQAVWAFVQRTRPTYIVSLHQPYAAIDAERIKSPTLAAALSRNLGLPIKWTGRDKTISHGTFTGTVNTLTSSAAITVEFSPSPSAKFLTFVARRAIVISVGGRY